MGVDGIHLFGLFGFATAASACSEKTQKIAELRLS
jgi:hypothetical protein